VTWREADVRCAGPSPWSDVLHAVARLSERARLSETARLADTEGPRPRWFRPGLASIALAALAVRVGYVLGWHHPAEFGGDSFYYHFGANLLAHGQGFPHPYRLLQDHVNTPGAQHPPLYIVALALGSVVGFGSYLDHQLLSCLMGTATVVLIGLIAARLAGPRAGLLAAAVAAVYPNLWFNDALVLSETLVQLTSAAVVLGAYVFWQRPNPRSAAVLGLLVGLAALTRAELILLTAVLVAPLCLLLRSTAWRRRVALLGLAALGFVVVVGPWCAYNLARFQQPALVTTGLDPTLVVSNCDDTYTGRDRGYWSYECFTRIPPPPGDESSQGLVYRRVAVDYIREHRSELPRVVLDRVGRTWGLYQPLRQLQLDTIETRELPASKVGLGMFYLLAVLSVFGVVHVRRRGLPVLPLLSLALVVTVAVALTFGQTRYRASAEVSVVVLGSVALAWLGSSTATRIAGRRSQPPTGQTPVATQPPVGTPP
jgi:4-amino-4-deoxy-L-arabinose transferase-like glycosyltransferase